MIFSAKQIHFRFSDVTELGTILLSFRRVNVEGLYLEFETSFFDSVKKECVSFHKNFNILENLKKSFLGSPYL